MKTDQMNSKKQNKQLAKAEKGSIEEEGGMSSKKRTSLPAESP